MFSFIATKVPADTINFTAGPTLGNTRGRTRIAFSDREALPVQQRARCFSNNLRGWGIGKEAFGMVLG